MRRLLPSLVLFLAAPLSAQAPLNPYGYPEKLAPRPTTGAVTAADLMTRLYIFADDSMEGRQSGRAGNERGTNYIANELKRLGIAPAGDNGGYFQTLPYIQRKFGAKTTLSARGATLRFNDDFVPVPGTRAPAPMKNVPVIYGGVSGDTTTMITPEQAKGKFVILAAGAAPAPTGGRGGFAGAWMQRLREAAAIATVNLDALTPAQRAAINEPMATFNAADAKRTVAAGDVLVSDGKGGVGVVRQGALIGGMMPSGMTAARAQAFVDSVNGAQQAPTGRGPAAAPPAPPQQFRLTSSAASALLGMPLASATPGTAGRAVSATYQWMETPTNYGRNVVAMIPGSDPALRGQYVVVGAHNDHVGFRATPVEHDSARAAAMIRLRAQMLTGDLLPMSPALAAALPPVDVAALRAIRPARMDSINNGADDDGSGSMAVLEIAEAIQAMPVKPKRSMVFVWHTAEESGMHGSRHFASNPTVPVDSIVTTINIDMVGRGRAEDVIGGGDTYVGVLGANRLSRSLGATLEAVNAKRTTPIHLDDRFDDPTLGTNVNGVVRWPGYNNLYGRSDHTRYAEKCIPIVFFFTGLHADYHQVTDEPQYIDYPHYATITQFIHELAVELGNQATRPALDQPCVRR